MSNDDGMVWYPAANASPSSVPTGFALGGPTGDLALTGTTATGNFRLQGSTTPPDVTSTVMSNDAVETREAISDAQLAELKRLAAQFDSDERHVLGQQPMDRELLAARLAHTASHLLSEVERLRIVLAHERETVRILSAGVRESTKRITALHHRYGEMHDVAKAVAGAGLDENDRADTSYLCFDGEARANELQQQARAIMEQIARDNAEEPEETEHDDLRTHM